MAHLHACTKYHIEYSSDAFFSSQRIAIEDIISDYCMCHFNNDIIEVDNVEFYELIQSIKEGDLDNDENFMDLTNEDNKNSIPVSELIEELTTLYDKAQLVDGKIYLKWF